MYKINGPIYKIYLSQGEPTKRVFPEDIKSWDTEMMADWLKKEAHAFLGAVFVNSDMPDKVVSLDDEHRSGFACRWIGCNMTFPLHSARKR